jgi:NAD(P)-dependent dehydrogenase (short-subunit alcohol dehydrogenase family)
VTGVFLSVQAFLPHLARATAPRIAIIASQMGSSTRAPGGSYIYRASKAAAINLGRNLATDLKPRGIAVGVYHPGWVQTDMGGASAEITTAKAVAGLVARFAALDLARTGCFETWDGRAHSF